MNYSDREAINDTRFDAVKKVHIVSYKIIQLEKQTTTIAFNI